MRRHVFLLMLCAIAFVSCKPKDKPPLSAETVARLDSEGVPQPVQHAFRNEHNEAHVDKVFKEIIGGKMHYFIKYTDANGRKGEVEYDAAGETALPRSAPAK